MTDTNADAPPDPLAEAIAAMERGNLVKAKRLAAELVRTSGDAAVRTRAENLLSQLAPDRVIVAVMLASGLLAVVLYVVYRH
ncbi:MAG: hypothetical protein WCJ30_13820 [Deltaproteobacteria bacterium]